MSLIVLEHDVYWFRICMLVLLGMFCLLQLSPVWIAWVISFFLPLAPLPTIVASQHAALQCQNLCWVPSQLPSGGVQIELNLIGATPTLKGKTSLGPKLTIQWVSAAACIGDRLHFLHGVVSILLWVFLNAGLCFVAAFLKVISSQLSQHQFCNLLPHHYVDQFILNYRFREE